MPSQTPITTVIPVATQGLVMTLRQPVRSLSSTPWGVKSSWNM